MWKAWRGDSFAPVPSSWYHPYLARSIWERARKSLHDESEYGEKCRDARYNIGYKEEDCEIVQLENTGFNRQGKLVVILN